MLELLDGTLDVEVVKKIFGEAASGEFAKTLGIFGFAAFIHGRQVSKAIRSKFDELVVVVRDDLKAQQAMLGQLGVRVSKIEESLHIKGETK